MDDIAKNYIDDLMKPIAAQVYDKEVVAWETKIKEEEKRNKERLRSPQFAESIGLPPNLPQFTINILKKTLAIDKYGPEKPEVSKVYRKFGL